MSVMAQYVVVGIVVAAAVAAAVRALWRLRGLSDRVKCAGCPLADACIKNNRKKCAGGVAQSEKTD